MLTKYNLPILLLAIAHLVTDLTQGAVPILPNDTADSLAERILSVEHSLYPQAVADFVNNRLHIKDGIVINQQPASASSKLLAF